MAITSGFFDSVSGDRTYDADQMSTYFEGLISDGVYENVGDRFAVTTANNGMNINVGSGRAIIQSHWVKNDATTVLTLDPADVQLNRVDAIVLRLDTSAREISLTVKKGTAVSGTPTMPTITRSGTVYELYIAAVLVNKNATQPTSITDLRPSSYCGWVTGIIQQVDTSDLFTQWQTAYQTYYDTMTAEFDAYMQSKMDAFNSWFATLTGQLKVETNITKFQNIVKLTTMDVVMSWAEIGIEEFDADTDVLLVFVNGVFFGEGNEYTISANGKMIDFNQKMAIGDEVTFVVLKNVIGGTVYASDAVLQSDVAATGTVLMAQEVTPTVTITCDQGYYFDSEVTCTLNGNQRKKSNSVPAIGVIAHFFGYCNPIFISPLSDGVLCTVGNDSVPANRTVIYGGIAWYWSTVNNGVGGSYDDSEGHMLTYPGSISSDDYSTSGGISPNYIRQILEYVHASAWEEF